MSLKKSIVRVFSANFIQVISNLIVGFFVPAILSIEGYAGLKTFTLFVSYSGLFHFGFIDGLYIKYGGKKITNIEKSELKAEHNFLIIAESIISIFIIIVGCIIKNINLILFGMTLLPIMIASFHKYLFQATGEFKKYSIVMYSYTLSYLIFNVILVLILKEKNYLYYCIISFIANLLSGIVFEINFIKNNAKIKANYSRKVLIKNIKIGIVILCGNLAVIGLYGIDKWFIKIFFETSDFAYYSFAVSMLHIVTTLVNAISITFYNYLFNNNNYNTLMKLQKYLAILGCFSSLAYFVLSFIVNTFLNKYVLSLNLISITFSTFPYMIIINAIFINLYKVNKDEKHYFRVVMSMLLISIIYNIVAVLLFKTTTAIAYATVLTIITWYIYSITDIKNIKVDIKLLIYMLMMTFLFLSCSHLKNYLIGGIGYLFIFSILTIIFYREIIFDGKEEIINILKSFGKRNKKGEKNELCIKEEN